MPSKIPDNSPIPPGKPVTSEDTSEGIKSHQNSQAHFNAHTVTSVEDSQRQTTEPEQASADKAIREMEVATANLSNDYEILEKQKINQQIAMDFYEIFNNTKQILDDLNNKRKTPAEKSDAEKKLQKINHDLLEFFRLLPPEELVKPLQYHEQERLNTEQIDFLQVEQDTLRLTRVIASVAEALNSVPAARFSLLQMFQTPEETLIANHLQHLSQLLAQWPVEQLLNGLAGEYTFNSQNQNSDHWQKCNELILASPNTVNNSKLSPTYNTDLPRGAEFVITSGDGIRHFASVDTKNQEGIQDLEVCSEKLVELCSHQRKSLLYIASNLVSQAAYNPLFHCIKAVMDSKYKNAGRILSSDYTMLTEFIPVNDSCIDVHLNYSFKKHKWIAEDASAICYTNQPLQISTSVRLDATNPESHQLSDIKIKIAAPTNIDLQHH